LNWQECKRFGVICPNWRLITQLDCLNGMRTVAFLDASAFTGTNPAIEATAPGLRFIVRVHNLRTGV